MESNKLLDILLLPKQVYQKLTDKKPFLYGGIIFVGAVDMVFPLIDHRIMVFGGKSTGMLNYNVGLAIIFILILGFVDVLFFGLPMFDFFRILKKEGPLFTNANLIRFTKSYILAHFLIVPFNAVFYCIMYNEQTSKAYPQIVIVIAALYYFFLMPAWFSGIIARGTNVIFDIEPNKKPLIYAAIFTWNFILSNYAFSYMIEHWVMWFFR